jgi:hypothetical protein
MTPGYMWIQLGAIHCVESVLEELYEVESIAAADGQNGPDLLVQYADATRRRCFGRTDWGFEGDRRVTQWLEFTESAARDFSLRFTITAAARIGVL